MFKKYFMKKYAISAAGADNLIKGALTRCLANLSLMLPMMLAFTFLYQFFHKLLGQNTLVNLNLPAYLLISVVSLIIIYFVAKLSYKYCYTTIYEESAQSRITLAETLRKLPLSYFGQKDLADLSATIMSDATMTEKLFSHAIPHVYGAVLSTAILMIMLFINNWQMSLALFWLVPFSLLIFTVSRKQQKKVLQAGFIHEREVIEQIQDNFELIQEIKAYNQEEKFIQAMNNKLDNLKKIKIKTDFTVGVFLNLAYTFLKLGIANTAFCGAYLLAQGNIDVFTYLVFIIISGSIYSPIMEILDNLAILLFVDVIVDRTKEIRNLPQQDGSTNFDPKNYDINFENVSFSYQPGLPTLKNISFAAKQGEVTALVGPSGGGKSSTAKCAARFWDIDSGKITLGGIDISQIEPETLLKKYSIVFQDIVLFNSSIMENIRLGNKEATDEQVKQAAKLAQCEEFIAKLPQGYDTLIGENGEKLSGGERQRISIARALLKDAPIILMDEATASLDAENETLIQAALSELIKDKTVIIIAHRMRTIVNADKIIVIKDGEIIEQGTAKQLLAQNSFFHNMYRIQDSLA